MAIGGVLCRSRVFVFEHCRVFNYNSFFNVVTNNEGDVWRGDRRWFATLASPQEMEVVVEYKKGLPRVRVPLPSSGQPCLFILRPVANTVQDLIRMITDQDPNVHTLYFATKDDCLIASSNRIENLMEDDFKMNLNDKIYYVKVPIKEDIDKENIARIGELKSLVNSLYITLNVEDHMAHKEKEIIQQLEQLRTTIEPLEKKKQELDCLATRRTTVMTWVGLGLMSVQFGILARLTWWEYSWDIMEPVTYFVTYGTAMAAYAYFVLTKQEYLLPDVRDRQHLITVHKRAAKVGLDLDEYNQLKSRINLLESTLTRVREPRLPPPLRPLPPPTTPPQTIISWIRNLARK